MVKVLGGEACLANDGNLTTCQMNDAGWQRRARRDIPQGSCGEGCRGCGGTTSIAAAVGWGPGRAAAPELFLPRLAHQF